MDKSHIYDISKMTDDEIIAVVKNIVNTHPRCGAMRIIKALPNKPIRDAIMRLTNFLDGNDDMTFVNLQTRIYMLVNGMMSIEQFPHCEHCKKIIKQNVVSVHAGFIYKTCSMSCAALNPVRKKKIADTNMKNHGVPQWSNGEKISKTLKNMDPQKRKETTAKMRKTRQKHIDENPNYWNDRLQKTRKTKLEKHGDEKWQNGKQISETKRRKAAEDSSYYKNALDKGRKTKLEKYGDENFSNPEKTKITKLERYGDPSYTNREKSKKTCMERYGVESFSQSSQYKESSRQTCIERYGVPYFMQSDEGKEMISHRNNTNYYNNVICRPDGEIEPLFSVEEYCQKTPMTQFKWRCKRCGSIFTGPQTITWNNCAEDGQVARCLTCHPVDIGKSEKQREIIQFVNKVTQGAFVPEDRKHICPYEIDMLNEKLMLGIEFDGIYWHCHFNGNPDNHLAAKTDMCNQKGITLVHVFEDEWDERKKQCKAMLQQIISADSKAQFHNASVVHISENECRKFLDENSYDIFSKPSRFNYGLINEGKLISCMTLSWFNNKALVTNICNSTAICTTQTYHMFIDFIQNEFSITHSIQSIQMNIDNRWPQDTLMNELKFNEVKKTAPSFWLIDMNEGWKRKCKGVNKKVLNQYGSYTNNNRKQFMYDNNLTYIVDCGCTVYERMVH